MPLLHRAVLKMPPVVPQPTPEDAIVNLNFIAIPGTVVFIAGAHRGVAGAAAAGAHAGSCSGSTLVQMLPSTLAISFMVGLAYVTRYSGMDTVLGLSLTGTGGCSRSSARCSAGSASRSRAPTPDRTRSSATCRR